MDTEASGSSLTDRQQFWLDHISYCDKAGNSSKAYAAEHGLSLHAMYSARKALVERGVLMPGGRGVRTDSTPRFSRVTSSSYSSRHGTDLALQLQLRNGTVVGFSSPLDAETLRLVLQTAAALP